jgi:beta-lactamase regulating signal transducer with metallopeptidase domain
MNIPEIIFSAGLDRALGWAVLHSLWQGTLVAFLTGILLIILRKKSAQTRYWVANLALWSVLCLAIGTFFWVANDKIVDTTPTIAAAESPTSIVQKAQEKFKVLPKSLPKTEAQEPTVKAEEGMTLQRFQAYFDQNLPLIVLIWFAGMGIFILRLLSSISQVYYLRRRMNFHADPYWTEILDGLAEKSGIRQGIELLESALVRSPLTIGHLKPVILFPIGILNRLSESEVEAIFAHELAHILRSDYLFNILQNLIQAIFYFHPAVWWLTAQVNKERENACDDHAIALLGNKVNYAKALVAIQEMAFFPQTPAFAMAFAGTKKNQLLMRVQRLFSPPKTNFNIMEKWISTAIVLCLVLAIAFGQNIQNGTLNPLSFAENAENGILSGLWEATFTADSVDITLSSGKKDNRWMHGDTYAKSDFTNLNITDGKTAFSMTRPAGCMTCRGEIEGKTGFGRYEYAPDEAYRSALQQAGIKEVDNELLMLCFYASFPADYPAKLKQMGFKNINREDLIQLAAFHLDEKTVRQYQDLAASLGTKQLEMNELILMKIANVTPDQVKRLGKAGYGDLSLNDISQLSLHGVEPEYIKEMNNAGLGRLSSENLLAAKIHGIDADFVKEAQKSGLNKVDFDDIVGMKIHGIDNDFIKNAINTGLNSVDIGSIVQNALSNVNINSNINLEGIDSADLAKAQKSGLGNLDMDDVMSMKIHGIDEAYIKKAQGMGLGKLNLDDIMSLKIHGIDEDFVRKAKGMGLGQLSLDDIMSMKIHGIDEDFVKKAQGMGLGQLSLDDIMSMKIHGIDENFIKKAQGMGLGQLSLDDIMSIKIHGIDENFVKKAQGMGLGQLSLDDIMSMKIHGVTPELANTFRDLGFKELSMDDLIAAKIHGITPEYIKEAEQKGYKFPSIDDYVGLKLRNTWGKRQ